MGNLIQCALAGSVFYLAVATIAAKLIVAASAAVAAISSAVFSEIGGVIFVEEGTVNITALSVAAGVLATFLSSQAVAMVMMHSDATDPTSFPGGGHWPAANTARYNDATINDTDADWNLKGE
ncbi:hypothetical protein [Actinoplanes palleronii]|uniref:Uncharacterized protein n=1 Tax=Actinoplanes palleronii TaxID=113570 RepID=A0ABQ4B7P4_9ACTN|nr:hypothetical protein [Actinoplanes palleronii]GIE66295.1 hypothetical protein Apa02nite_024030 [Actinoplanes palleronii]